MTQLKAFLHTGPVATNLVVVIVAIIGGIEAIRGVISLDDYLKYVTAAAGALGIAKGIRLHGQPPTDT